MESLSLESEAEVMQNHSHNKRSKEEKERRRSLLRKAMESLGRASSSSCPGSLKKCLSSSISTIKDLKSQSSVLMAERYWLILENRELVEYLRGSLHEQTPYWEDGKTLMDWINTPWDGSGRPVSEKEARKNEMHIRHCLEEVKKVKMRLHAEYASKRMEVTDHYEADDLLESGDLIKNERSSTDEVDCEMKPSDVISECQPDPSDTVQCEMDKGGVIKCEMDTRCEIKCELEQGDAIKCEIDSSDAIRCENSSSNKNECRLEPSETVKTKIESDDAISCAMDQTDVIKCAENTRKANKCTLDLSDAVDCMVKQSDEMECKMDQSDAIRCQKTPIDAIKSKFNSNDAIGCEMNSNVAVKCEVDSNKPYECENDTTNQNQKSKSKSAEDPDNAIKCETNSSDAIKNKKNEEDAFECETNANDAVQSSIETRVWCWDRQCLAAPHRIWGEDGRPGQEDPCPSSVDEDGGWVEDRRKNADVTDNSTCEPLHTDNNSQGNHRMRDTGFEAKRKKKKTHHRRKERLVKNKHEVGKHKRGKIRHVDQSSWAMKDKASSSDSDRHLTDSLPPLGLPSDQSDYMSSQEDVSVPAETLMTNNNYKESVADCVQFVGKLPKIDMKDPLLADKQLYLIETGTTAGISTVTIPNACPRSNPSHISNSDPNLNSKLNPNPTPGPNEENVQAILVPTAPGQAMLFHPPSQQGTSISCHQTTATSGTGNSTIATDQSCSLQEKPVTTPAKLLGSNSISIAALGSGKRKAKEHHGPQKRKMEGTAVSNKRKKLKPTLVQPSNIKDSFLAALMSGDSMYGGSATQKAQVKSTLSDIKGLRKDPFQCPYIKISSRNAPCSVSATYKDSNKQKMQVNSVADNKAVRRASFPPASNKVTSKISSVSLSAASPDPEKRMKSPANVKGLRRSSDAIVHDFRKHKEQAKSPSSIKEFCGSADRTDRDSRKQEAPVKSPGVRRSSDSSNLDSTKQKMKVKSPESISKLRRSADTRDQDSRKQEAPVKSPGDTCRKAMRRSSDGNVGDTKKQKMMVKSPENIKEICRSIDRTDQDSTKQKAPVESPGNRKAVRRSSDANAGDTKKQEVKVKSPESIRKLRRSADTRDQDSRKQEAPVKSPGDTCRKAMRRTSDSNVGDITKQNVKVKSPGAIMGTRRSVGTTHREVVKREIQVKSPAKNKQVCRLADKVTCDSTEKNVKSPYVTGDKGAWKSVCIEDSTIHKTNLKSREPIKGGSVNQESPEQKEAPKSSKNVKGKIRSAGGSDSDSSKEKPHKSQVDIKRKDKSVSPQDEDSKELKGQKKSVSSAQRSDRSLCEVANKGKKSNGNVKSSVDIKSKRRCSYGSDCESREQTKKVKSPGDVKEKYPCRTTCSTESDSTEVKTQRKTVANIKGKQGSSVIMDCNSKEGNTQMSSPACLKSKRRSLRIEGRDSKENTIVKSLDDMKRSGTSGDKQDRKSQSKSSENIKEVCKTPGTVDDESTEQNVQENSLEHKKSVGKSVGKADGELRESNSELCSPVDIDKICCSINTVDCNPANHMEQRKSPEIKKRRGRPPGSKKRDSTNLKAEKKSRGVYSTLIEPTVIRVTFQNALKSLEVKKRRGRPLGSKNRISTKQTSQTTLQDLEEQRSESERRRSKDISQSTTKSLEIKKRRGRPIGSKNCETAKQKTQENPQEDVKVIHRTVVEPTVMKDTCQSAPISPEIKKRRGRPPGSRNRETAKQIVQTDSKVESEAQRTLKGKAQGLTNQRTFSESSSIADTAQDDGTTGCSVDGNATELNAKEPVRRKKVDESLSCLLCDKKCRNVANLQVHLISSHAS